MPTLSIIKIYQQISNNLNNPNFNLSLEAQQTIFAFFYNNFSNLQSLEKSMLDVIITFIINYKKEICPEGKKLLFKHVISKACAKNNLPPIPINYIESSNKVNGFIPHHKRINISSSVLSYKLYGNELISLLPETSILRSTNNMLIIIFIINHLIEHYHQYNDKRNNLLTEETLSYTKCSLLHQSSNLSSSPFCNISYPEIENYANSRAINNTLEYLSQYQYANKKHLDYLYQEWLQLNNNNHILSYANIYFDILQLLNTIQNNPSLLNTNQLLKTFFQKDQSSNISLKPLNILVNEYNQLRSTYSNIIAHQKETVYRQFILFLIIEQDFQINSEESENYCRVIFEIIRDCLNSLTISNINLNQETTINALTSKLSIIIKLINLLKNIDKENKYLYKCQYFIKEFLNNYNNSKINNLELVKLITELTAINLPNEPPIPNDNSKKTLKL